MLFVYIISRCFIGRMMVYQWLERNTRGGETYIEVWASSIVKVKNNHLLNQKPLCISCTLIFCIVLCAVVFLHHVWRLDKKVPFYFRL